MVFLKAWKRVNQYKQVTQVLCQQAFYFIFTFFAFNYSVQKFLLRKPVYIWLKVKMQLAKDYFWPSIDLHLAVVSFITVIVCTPTPSLFLLWGVKPRTKFSKGGRGGVRGSQFLERGCWERGDDLSQGGWSFCRKNKPKSETLNAKKKL